MVDFVAKGVYVITTRSILHFRDFHRLRGRGDDGLEAVTTIPLSEPLDFVPNFSSVAGQDRSLYGNNVNICGGQVFVLNKEI